jgi:DNA-binding GntR family transcriptional regulator
LLVHGSTIICTSLFVHIHQTCIELATAFHCDQQEHLITSHMCRALLEEALQLERQLHIALLADKMTQQEEQQQQQKGEDQEQQEEGEQRQQKADADAAAAGSLAIPGGSCALLTRRCVYNAAVVGMIVYLPALGRRQALYLVFRRSKALCFC